MAASSEAILRTAFVPHGPATVNSATGIGATSDEHRAPPVSAGEPASDGDDARDSESESSTDSEEAALMRLAAMKANREGEWKLVKPRKRRARTLPVVHTGESAHRLLHRSADVTHKTLAQPEVKMTRGDKTVSGDKTTVADFKHTPCDVCTKTRMVAPSRRQSAMCRECGTHLE